MREAAQPQTEPDSHAVPFPFGSFAAPSVLTRLFAVQSFSIYGLLSLVNFLFFTFEFVVSSYKMALPVPRAPGFAQMMKEGASQYSGLDEAVLRSIDACNEFTRTMRTSYGPRGLNKMIINHLEKLFVTNDAATIIRELAIEHPAAKIIVMGSQMQEQEVGDGTNFVILLAGALLEQAEDLIRLGLKPTEIIEGYEIARDLILEKYLPALAVKDIKDVRNLEEVTPIIRSSVMAKQYGREDLLANIIARACVSVHGLGHSFNVDNVRVCKIVGSGVSQIDLVQGMVFKRQVESTLTKVQNAKVVVFTCPVDISATETKGTVLIKSAEELRNFSTGEEGLLEEQIKAIAEAGVNVVVSGGKFGDLAGHYCNKYGIMMVRLQSKFDIRRLSKTVGATVLPKLQAPRVSEIGMCDQVYIDEIGEIPLVIFKQNASESRLATIVVRGSTDNILDDIERAIDDGVNTYKTLCNDGRVVYGAGASEIELAQELSREALQLPGMEQYAVGKFAEALQSLPAALADNAGTKSNDVVTLLIAAHQNGQKQHGVDIESDVPKSVDAKQASLYDLYAAKFWGVRYATNAACTVLKVDQIICAKPAGGPKPRENQDWDQD